MRMTSLPATTWSLAVVVSPSGAGLGWVPCPMWPDVQSAVAGRGRPSRLLGEKTGGNAGDNEKKRNSGHDEGPLVLSSQRMIAAKGRVMQVCDLEMCNLEKRSSTCRCRHPSFDV